MIVADAPNPRSNRAEYEREWAKRNRDKRNLYRKRWMDKNPEKHAQYTRQYRVDHSEAYKIATRKTYVKHRESRIARMAVYRANNPEKVKASARRFCFGKAGQIYYEQQLSVQNGRCAICNRTAEETGCALGLDHNHEFGPKDPHGWRGLLCKFCNAGIAQFGENVDLLGGTARQYLLKWRSTCQ